MNGDKFHDILHQVKRGGVLALTGVAALTLASCTPDNADAGPTSVASVSQGGWS